MANLSNINNKFLVTTGGNVGIGTTSPNVLLDVWGATPTIRAVGTSASNPSLTLTSIGITAWSQTVSGSDSSLSFNKDGSEKMRIDTSGNVGIGTASPGAKLEVAGGADAIARVLGTTTAARLDLQTNSYHKFIQIIESDGRFRLYNQTTSLEQLTVLNSGNVGIGTNSPSQDLTLYRSSGDTNFLISSNNGASQIFFGDTESDNIGKIDYDHSDNSLSLVVNAAERMRIEADGQVSLRTAGAHLMFQNTVGTAPYIANAGTGYADLTIATGGSERMRITSAGNVGIGTTGPLTKLDVRGSTFVSGYLAGFDTSPQGNYAYRLTNDGANSFINVLGGNLGIGTTSPKTTLDITGSGNTAINSKGNLLVSSGGTATQVAETGGQISFGSWLNGDLTQPYPLAAIRGVAESSTTNNNRGALIFGTMDSNTTVQERMRIDSSGYVNIKQKQNSGLAYDILINLGTSPDGKIAYQTQDQLAANLAVNANSNWIKTGNNIYNSNSANVGIGTTSPGAKLDVVGSGKFQPGIADGDALVTIAQTNTNAYVHAGIKINAGNTNPFYIYQSGSSNTLRFNYNSLADAGGQLVITDSGNVGIGITPTQKLDVAGIVKHQGLDMTAGVQVDQITSISVSLSGAAGSWHETGIDGTDIGSNGSYVIQVYSNTQGAGASNYSMYWTGVMSWYYTATNSVNTSEIYLNSAGHYRGMDLELRTISSPNSATPPSMRIQFKSNQTLTGHAVVFKFRRLM